MRVALVRALNARRPFCASKPTACLCVMREGLRANLAP